MRILCGHLLVVTILSQVVDKAELVSPTPPTFPPDFSVAFNEITFFKNGHVLSQNPGAWYYDYTNKQARYDHGQGQTNNFCDYQGLSPKDPKAPCSLLFTPKLDLFVYYPAQKNCCRLCGEKQGCTILRPDWIQQGAHLFSVEMIDGVKCYGWAKKGAVAPDDVWYDDDEGKPCRYHEIVEVFHHNLTFIKDTYKVGPQPQQLFDVPDYCNRTCPHPYVPPKIKRFF